MVRVRAVNAAGVGMASMPSDPVTAEAVEGTTHFNELIKLQSEEKGNNTSNNPPDNCSGALN